MNTNLYNIINILKRISLENQLVNQFTDGDVYENLNTAKNDKYPAVNFMVESVNVGDNMQTINGVLFYVDRLTDDNSNKVEIQTNAIHILQSILNKICEEYGWTIDSQTYNIFEEKFTDLCAGAYATFSLVLPKEEICADDVFVPKTLTITENGTYNTYAYDETIVNVRYIGGVNTSAKPYLDLLCQTDNVSSKAITDVEDYEHKITYINKPYAFKDCINLKTAKLNDVTNISVSSTFYNCTGLTEVQMDNLETLAEGYTFYNCKSLVSISLPKLKTLTINKDYTFTNCSNLKYVNLPELQANLDGYQYTFASCASLEEIHLPKQPTLPLGMFRWDNALKIIDMPSCQYLNNAGMIDTPNVEYLTVGKVLSWNVSTWWYYFYQMKKITIGEGTDINIPLHLWNGTPSSAEQFNIDFQDGIVDKLYNYSGGETHTITLGSQLREKISQETIDKANAKNWTIAFS